MALQLTMICLGLDGDEMVVVPHMFLHQKLKNIRREDRVVLSVDSSDTDPIGVRYYPVIHGRGWITDGGFPEFLRKLAPQMLPPGARFPARNAVG